MLGKYELYEPLGQGGFGTVYRARDTLLNVPRALKLLHPALVADPVFIDRFRQEAQIAARLEHAHIIPVYDLGEQGGRFFLAMKLMPGGSLKDRLAQETRLPYLEAVRIITQVASALDFAARQPEKLIHRDVKPGNILLEADGTARLSDFGFARVLAGDSGSSLSVSGGLVGTLAYLAPEIWNDQPASPASDQYSLACVFYELITGQSLFGGGDSPLPVIMRRHLEPLALPRQWHAGVPGEVTGILNKALAKEPENRYASAVEFAQALSAVLAQAQLVEAEARRIRFSSTVQAITRAIEEQDWTLAERQIASLEGGDADAQAAAVELRGNLTAAKRQEELEQTRLAREQAERGRKEAEPSPPTLPPAGHKRLLKQEWNLKNHIPNPSLAKRKVVSICGEA
ncbi:MAG: serine/threonine protein kinase, partial [Anaerolineales bacterium]|nr:serine/threonine protein kinase [Anaerolineales bacterium]